MIIPHFMVLIFISFTVTEESLNHIIVDWMVVGIFDCFKTSWVFSFFSNPISPVILIYTLLLFIVFSSFFTSFFSSLLCPFFSFSFLIRACISTGISISPLIRLRFLLSKTSHFSSSSIHVFVVIMINSIIIILSFTLSKHISSIFQ